jgi:hypothetical protein
MAQMPSREQRPTPGSTGELWREGSAGLARSTQLWPPFLPFDHLDALRRAPRLDPTITLNGRIYREADNGRANNLVPAEDRLFPPARRQALREGFERASGGGPSR